MLLVLFTLLNLHWLSAHKWVVAHATTVNKLQCLHTMTDCACKLPTCLHALIHRQPLYVELMQQSCVETNEVASDLQAT